MGSPQSNREQNSRLSWSAGLRLRNTEMTSSNADYRVVIFGAGGVGKTSIITRFLNGSYQDTYIATTEDTYKKIIKGKEGNVILEITDTTGSHQFPAMRRLSVVRGHAFVLVFSISSKQSLTELKPILELINEIKGTMADIPLVLVGNKNDEEAGPREVSYATGETLQEMWKCTYIETSAKRNFNIESIFEEILELEQQRALYLQSEEEKDKKKKKNCVLL